ncbi:MAG: PIN domain-containing protein [Kiritimatiellae bacterium]|nr:PIN domain-containing protein [Kiritimatiellia bacterium]
MVFLDTNILTYASTTQDMAKRGSAQRLLNDLYYNLDGCISMQVLRELANVLFKKFSLPASEVRRIVTGFSTLPCVEETRETLDRAISIKERYGLQFYDSLIVASAAEASCTTLYSEDLSDGMVYDGVRIENPFRQKA